MAQVETDAAPVVHVVVEHENGKIMPENGALKASHEIEYHQLRPHLVLHDTKASEAIEFYKKAFGATEVVRTLHPKRKVDQEHPLILHAHLKMGDAHFTICDDYKEIGETVKSPPSFKGTTVLLHLETSDVDAVFSRALEAGANVTEEITNQPWGQRYGMLTDPFGFVWSIATPLKESGSVEDTSILEA